MYALYYKDQQSCYGIGTFLLFHRKETNESIIQKICIRSQTFYV